MKTVFFDLETTGVSIDNDRIIQFAGIDSDGNELDILINPQMFIPEEAVAVHGITNEDVQFEKTFPEVAETIYNFCNNAILAGYNSNNFDVPMLKKNLFEAGFSLKDNGMIDVLKIERSVNSHKLGNTFKRYTGKELENAHNALADVKATMKILELQKKIFKLTPDVLLEFSKDDKQFLDWSKRIFKKDNEIFWNFGKHKNKEVLSNIGYLNWVLDADFPEDMKTILTNYKNNKL